MITTEFVKVERELVEELEKRGLELEGADLDMATEYIVITRSVKPTYSVSQYIADTLSYYPEMLPKK